MKRIFTLCIILCTALAGFAQTDTTGTQSPANEKADTIRIGGMIIIRKPGGKGKDIVRDREINISTGNRKKSSNISTNWWIIDLGFANLNDRTDYSSAALQNPVTGFAPGLTKDNFKLKTGKSVNVNIWFFMQKLNIIKHVVNLKYGMGLELNNYRFDDGRLVFEKNPTQVVLSTTDYRKNKLAADYITVPLMFNFNFTPHRKKGFGISAGMSAGYLYSSRQKFKNDGHKDKTHGDFDLEQWKLSYIGELSLGPVKLYGSYATRNMWSKGLDQTPYTVGIRFSHF